MITDVDRLLERTLVHTIGPEGHGVRLLHPCGPLSVWLEREMGMKQADLLYSRVRSILAGLVREVLELEWPT